jgi:hypothetical protein
MRHAEARASASSIIVCRAHSLLLAGRCRHSFYVFAHDRCGCRSSSSVLWRALPWHHFESMLHYILFRGADCLVASWVLKADHQHAVVSAPHTAVAKQAGACCTSAVPGSSQRIQYRLLLKGPGSFRRYLRCRTTALRLYQMTAQPYV